MTNAYRYHCLMTPNPSLDKKVVGDGVSGSNDGFLIFFVQVNVPFAYWR
jgi:hypothetical protein